MAVPQLTEGRVGRTRETSFGDLGVAYDERVLPAGACTVKQSTWAFDLLGDLPAGPSLELCCGAGHTEPLAVRGSVRDLVEVDLDPVTCILARLNADHAEPRVVSVDVCNSGPEEVVEPGEQCAPVIADPPYLPRAEVNTYPEDPEPGIDGGPDGSDLVWACLGVILSHLAPGVQLLIQLRDGGQTRAVRDGLNKGAYADLRLVERHEVGHSGVVRRLAASRLCTIVTGDLPT